MIASASIGKSTPMVGIEFGCTMSKVAEKCYRHNKSAGEKCQYNTIASTARAIIAVAKKENFTLYQDQRDPLHKNYYKYFYSQRNKYIPIATQKGQLIRWGIFGGGQWCTKDEVEGKKRTLDNHLQILAKMGMIKDDFGFKRGKLRLEINREWLSLTYDTSFLAAVSDDQPQGSQPSSSPQRHVDKPGSSSKDGILPISEIIDRQAVTDEELQNLPTSRNNLKTNKQKNNEKSPKRVDKWNGKAMTSDDPSIDGNNFKTNKTSASRKKNAENPNSAAPEIKSFFVDFLGQFQNSYLPRPAKNSNEYRQQILQNQKYASLYPAQQEKVRYALFLYNQAVNTYYDGMKTNRKYTTINHQQQNQALMWLTLCLEKYRPQNGTYQQAFNIISWGIAKATEIRKVMELDWVYSPDLFFSLEQKDNGEYRMKKACLRSILAKHYPAHLKYQQEYQDLNLTLQAQGYAKINLHRRVDRCLGMMKTNREFNYEKLVKTFEKDFPVYRKKLDGLKLNSFSKKERLLEYVDFWLSFKLKQILEEVNHGREFKIHHLLSRVDSTIISLRKICDQIGATPQEVERKVEHFKNRIQFLNKK